MTAAIGSDRWWCCSGGLLQMSHPPPHRQMRGRWSEGGKVSKASHLEFAQVVFMFLITVTIPPFAIEPIFACKPYQKCFGFSVYSKIKTHCLLRIMHFVIYSAGLGTAEMRIQRKKNSLPFISLIPIYLHYSGFLKCFLFRPFCVLTNTSKHHPGLYFLKTLLWNRICSTVI